MFGLSKIAAVGAVAVALGVIGLAGLNMRLSAKLSAAQTDLRDTQAELATCAGRILNIQEDRASDAIVDSPDFSIPDHWMLPPTD